MTSPTPSSAEQEFVNYNTCSCDHNPHGRCNDCVGKCQESFYKALTLAIEQEREACINIVKNQIVNETGVNLMNDYADGVCRGIVELLTARKSKGE